jgi:hypothetical protein
VKYIAKSAAKNISSLESQTIVPTATILGRLRRAGVARALDMWVIIPEASGFYEIEGSQNTLIAR